MKLTKKEKAVLGRQYAEGLFLGRIKSPADLPVLTERGDWQDANDYERRRIMSELATVARDELLNAGHNRETVLSLVNPYIRQW